MLTHGAVSLVYDGDGNRVAEAVGGVTTKYLVDTLNPTGLPQVMDELVGKYVYTRNNPVNRLDPSGRADLAEVDLVNAEVAFSDHGLAHLIQAGAQLNQAEVEALIEALVRQFIADLQAAGSNLISPFDLVFQSPLLQNMPWAARVFIVTAVDIRISTYFPLR